MIDRGDMRKLHESIDRDGLTRRQKFTSATRKPIVAPPRLKPWATQTCATTGGPPLQKNAYEGSRCGLFGGESGVIEDDLGEDPAFDAFESPYPWRQGREPAAECG